MNNGFLRVAAANPDNRDYHQILKQADSALYAAKNRGKNQVVLFDSATMSEGTYRTEASSGDGVSKGRAALSSNPQSRRCAMLYSVLIFISFLLHMQMLSHSDNASQETDSYAYQQRHGRKYAKQFLHRQKGQEIA